MTRRLLAHPPGRAGAEQQARTRSHRARRTLTAVLLGVTLAACTAGPPAERSTAPTTPTEPGAPTTGSAPSAQSAQSAPAAASPPSAPSAPPAPSDNACYRLAWGELTALSSTTEPVSCTAGHTAQTIHVGRLDTVVEGHAVAVDSDRVQAQVARDCPRHLARAVGGSPQDRDLSRLRVIWFVPSLDESDQGADWYRCDVVALAGGDQLFRLPPPRRLAGLLDTPGGRARYGLCGRGTFGAPSFDRVICARPHGWRAVATIPLGGPGGGGYPGAGEVRRTGDERCADLARERAGDPLRFRYGWEWPTRQQWQTGQRFGYCWVPG